MNAVEKTVKVKAKIGNDIVEINFASESMNAYLELERSGAAEYLGHGQYYSYDEVFATDKRVMYFWKWNHGGKPKLAKTNTVDTLPTSEFLKKHKSKNDARVQYGRETAKCFYVSKI